MCLPVSTVPGDNDRSVAFDLLCFSHVHWDDTIEQIPALIHHCAQRRRVFFIEEPHLIEDDRGQDIHVEIQQPLPLLWRVVPSLSMSLPEHEGERLLSIWLDEFCRRFAIDQYLVWYTSPFARSFSGHLEPLALIYAHLDNSMALESYTPHKHLDHHALLYSADLILLTSHHLSLFTYAHTPVFCLQDTQEIACSTPACVLVDIDDTTPCSHSIGLLINAVMEALVLKRLDWLPYSTMAQDATVYTAHSWD